MCLWADRMTGCGLDGLDESDGLDGLGCVGMGCSFGGLCRLVLVLCGLS